MNGFYLSYPEKRPAFSLVDADAIIEFLLELVVELVFGAFL